jgi:SAM-dependent methyltransferase
MPSPEQWIEILAPHDVENERHAMAMFAVLGQPASYLDVGSGTGAMVNLARKLGVDAYGLDQVPRQEAHLMLHDLRKPFAFKTRFQLVSCIEVAEHIPEKEIGPLLASCAKHVAEGRYLVWSAAHPGQSGDDHGTLWPAYKWRDEFHLLGMTWNEYMTLRLATVWRMLPTPLMWLAENVQVFTREVATATSLEPEEEK